MSSGCPLLVEWYITPMEIDVICFSKLCGHVQSSGCPLLVEWYIAPMEIDVICFSKLCGHVQSRLIQLRSDRKNLNGILGPKSIDAPPPAV